MNYPLVRRFAPAAVAAAVLTMGLGTASASAALPAAGTAPSNTKLALTPTSVVSGQLVHLRATVAPVGTGAAPTGTVTFLEGTTVLGTAPLALVGTAQVARLTHKFVIGSHSLTARYEGDTTYASSTSLPATLTVTKAASSSTLSETAGATPGTYNVVTAEKAVAPGSGTPTGTVTIKVDNLAPQTLALNSKGRAHLTLPLAHGSHTATVTYGGDANFTGSTGNLTFTI